MWFAITLGLALWVEMELLGARLILGQWLALRMRLALKRASLSLKLAIAMGLVMWVQKELVMRLAIMKDVPTISGRMNKGEKGHGRYQRERVRNKESTRGKMPRTP